MRPYKRKLFLGRVEKQITGAVCPRCGADADGATGIDDSEPVRAPKPGDLVVCLYCGSFNVYREDLTQREMTAEELASFERDPRLADLLEIAARATLAWRKSH
jgi:hypothetical protein